MQYGRKLLRLQGNEFDREVIIFNQVIVEHCTPFTLECGVLAIYVSDVI